MKTLRTQPPCSSGNATNFSAFTLVEMVVAAAIFAAIVFLMAGVIREATRAWSRANSTMQTSQSARVAVDMMSRDLQSIFTFRNTITHTFQSSAITFNAAVINPSGAWDISQIRYYLSGSGTIRTLTRSVTFTASTGTTTNAPSETTEIISNVASVSATEPGLELFYRLKDGTATIFSASATSVTPSQVTIRLRVWDPTTIKVGRVVTAGGGTYATYETTVFLPMGLK